MKKIFNVITEAFGWISLAALIVCVAALLITRLSGKVPQFFGYRVFVIATGSMAPELEVGDVILSKCFSPGDKLEKNDILTYEGSGDTEGYLVTHRLVSFNEENGIRMLTLRGDANNMSDKPIPEDKVVAKYITKLRVFGIVYSLMQSDFGMPVLIIIIMFFIIKEGIEFSKSIEKSKNSNEENNKR